MAETTKIEWTDATWNPITGCTLVSEGCRYCYAATLAALRLKHHPSRKGLARMNAGGEAKFTGEVRFNEQWIDQPVRWRKPRMIFVCAHGDLFHEAVPDEWIDRVFAVMALSPQHVFQVLTKRPERARAYLSALPCRQEGDRAWPVNPLERIAHDLFEDRGFDGDAAAKRAFDAVQNWPLSHVWIGTSIENQSAADARVPHLLDTPAAVRFVSAEPLLGRVYLNGIMSHDGGIYALTGVRSDGSGPSGFSQGARLDWVIVGGESGTHARPMHPDWARSLRDECQAEGVPFFFKQWGTWFPGEIEDPADGRGMMAFPDIEHDPGAADWEGRWKYSVIGEGRDREGMLLVGKARAGRLLDGREWSEMPEVRP